MKLPIKSVDGLLFVLVVILSVGCLPAKKINNSSLMPPDLAVASKLSENPFDLLQDVQIPDANIHSLYLDGSQIQPVEHPQGDVINQFISMHKLGQGETSDQWFEQPGTVSAFLFTGDSPMASGCSSPLLALLTTYGELQTESPCIQEDYVQMNVIAIQDTKKLFFLLSHSFLPQTLYRFVFAMKTDLNGNVTHLAATNSVHALTVTENTDPVISLLNNEEQIYEEASGASYLDIFLSKPLGEQKHIRFNSMGADPFNPSTPEATYQQDYKLGNLVVQAEQTEASHPLMKLDDIFCEPQLEAAKIRLANPALNDGFILGSSFSKKFYIQDDDQNSQANCPGSQTSLPDAAFAAVTLSGVLEGFLIPGGITLSHPAPAGGLHVEFEIASGTTSLENQPSGFEIAVDSLYFPPGENYMNLPIQTFDDSLCETGEFINIRLLEGNGYDLTNEPGDYSVNSYSLVDPSDC